MSWSFPPRGVVSADGATATSQFFLEPSTATVYDCVNPISHASVECHPPEIFASTEPFTPLDDCVAAVPDSYDWYTVNLHVDFPVVEAGLTGCNFFGIYGGCGDRIGGSSDGEVDVDFVASGDGSPLASTGSQPDYLADSWDIPDTIYSFVLNPSPTFPVPDADGNDAGSVLFTRAQLEALAVTFTYEGNWGWWDPVAHPHVVTLRAGVIAYNEVAPTTASWMCVT